MIEQIDGGAVQAQPPDRIAGRLAYHAAINAMEVIRGKMGNPSHRVEVERVVQVFGYVSDDAPDPRRVAALRFHHVARLALYV